MFTNISKENRTKKLIIFYYITTISDITAYPQTMNMFRFSLLNYSSQENCFNINEIKYTVVENQFVYMLIECKRRRKEVWESILYKNDRKTEMEKNPFSSSSILCFQIKIQILFVHFPSQP